MQTLSTARLNQPYSVEVIRYYIAAEQQADFEQAYDQASQHLMASPYCLAYQLLHGVEQADHYVVLIHWTSMNEHLTEFRQSNQFAAFFAFVKPYYTAIQEMKHYEVVGNS